MKTITLQWVIWDGMPDNDTSPGVLGYFCEWGLRISDRLAREPNPASDGGVFPTDPTGGSV
jgi:hypothetical protein